MVTETGPLPDFTGLSVAVGSKALLRVASTSIKSDVKLVRTVRRAPVHAFWRWDDTSPFFGGAAIDRLTNPVTRTYPYCATGFAARKSNGQEAMITARHCGTSVDWRTPVGDRLVGRSEGGNAGLDATVMTGADYSPSIYVGAWDSSLSRPVVGAGNPAANSYVFPSGSFSGAWVVQVRQVNVYANVDGRTTGPGFFTEDSSRRGVVGNGDSGGPTAQGCDHHDGDGPRHDRCDRPGRSCRVPGTDRLRPHLLVARLPCEHRTHPQRSRLDDPDGMSRGS